MLRKCFDPLPNELVWNDSNTYNLFFLEKFATRKLIRAVKILIELILIPIIFTRKKADLNRDHFYWWSNFKSFFSVWWLMHDKIGNISNFSWYLLTWTDICYNIDIMLMFDNNISIAHARGINLGIQTKILTILKPISVSKFENKSMDCRLNRIK